MLKLSVDHIDTLETKMDQEDYRKIEVYCKRILVKNLHSRHLEDMIQDVAMKFWIKKGQANINWLALDYLRVNGLGPRGKAGAKTFELSISIDNENINDSENDCSYLLDEESEERSKTNEEMIFFEDNMKGAIEDFLMPLKFETRTMKWILSHYRPKMKL